jgi:Fe-S cluster assembly ATPase SufC
VKRTATENKGIPITEFRKMMIEKMELLKMDKEFARRYQRRFFRREKKRAENFADGLT